MKAYELFESHQWNKGDYAIGEHGNPISPFHERAVSFCMIGALFRCYRQSAELYDAYDRVARHIPNEFKKYVTFASAIVKWNDHHDRTKEDVIEVLRKADV